MKRKRRFLFCVKWTLILSLLIFSFSSIAYPIYKLNIYSLTIMKIMLKESSREFPPIDERHPSAYLWLGLERVKLRDCQGALDAINEYKTEKYRHSIKGKIAAECGDALLASKEFLLLDDWLSLINYGQIAFNEKNYEDAFTLWNSAFLISPEKATGRLAYLLAYGMQDVGGAITLIEEILQKYPKSPHRKEWFQQLGDYLALQQKYEDSLLAYQQSVNIDPENAWGWIGLGQGYRRMGNLIDAESAFEHAVSLSDSNFGAYNLLGDIRYEQRLWVEAAGAYQKAGDLEPIPMILIKQANSWVNVPDCSKAIDLYEEIIHRFKIDLDSHTLALIYIDEAFCLKEKGLYNKARQRADMAIMADPEDDNIIEKEKLLFP